MKEASYSLRERKYAKTKVMLARGFVERLKDTSFADISIKEVCEMVEVSEGTFYNYFPQKIDVILFFEKLQILKIQWEIKQKWFSLDSIDLLDLAFALLTKELDQPYLFYEFISIFTSQRQKPKPGDLLAVEKLYAYPECHGVEDIVLESLDGIFSKIIEKLIIEHRIKENIKIEDIVLSLKTILLGVPLSIEIEDFDQIGKKYNTQLSFFKQIFLKGI
ncbi:MAG: TetR/AcrR family transcriptional regulator [Candidatus Omnitrophica bacterium]|nr:TetR/AcrR family transcriptional regulator [Candidatus Omnitrophota bacterium]